MKTFSIPSILHLVPRSKNRIKNISSEWLRQYSRGQTNFSLNSFKNLPFLSQLMLNETMLQDWGRNSCFPLLIDFQFNFRVRNFLVNFVKRIVLVIDQNSRKMICCSVVVVIRSVIEQSKSHY